MSAPVATPLEPIPVAPLLTRPPIAQMVVAERLPDVPREPVVVFPQRSRVRLVWDFIASVTEWLFGLAALIMGLAILSAVPVGQFLTLGYLLESAGRIARSGRLRDGFIGIRRVARIGGIALGCGICWLPVWALSIAASSARIIDTSGRIAGQWEFALTLVGVLFALHISAALLRGGKLRYFFWPFNAVWIVRRIWNGNFYREARDGLWDTVVAMRLPYFFWLGVRGFVGGFLWLAFPLLLLGQGHKVAGVGVLGAILLTIVVLYVPFLQTRFARDNRLRAFREVGSVRADFRKAPILFAIAFFFHLLFAVPLYLMKIEAIPKDLVFLESLVFLAFMFPARLMLGFAYSRAAKRERPRHWTFRWSARFFMLAVSAFYVLIVFGSQHLAWRGIPSLYEQHAFLLPVPFALWE